MFIARLFVLFVSILSGLFVSYVFALAYAHASPSVVMIAFSVVATLIWIYAVGAPLAFPVYKGILPALYPMIGLLSFGLVGFGIGWLVAGFFYCIADWRRFDRLSEMTGGAPPTEIIPLQAIGILVAGTGLGIWFANKGCPILQPGQQFLVTFTQEYFLGLSTGTPGIKQFVNTISVAGALFVGVRGFSLLIMQTLLERPQIPRIP